MARGSTARSTGIRGWWGLAVLAPVLYAAGHLAHLASGDGGDPTIAVWVAKWLTVPSLPILLLLMGERVADRPGRWRTASATWLVIGVGLVLATVGGIGPLTEAIGSAAYHRVWPGELTGADQRNLDTLGGLGPGWTPGAIVARELAAIVVLAVASGLALRLAHRNGPPAAPAVVPIVVAAGLGLYQFVAPWSFRSDFDFFVGDAVLGGTLGELVFFPAPFDPIGALAIGLAALSMGGLVLAWGRPADPADHPGAPPAVADVDARTPAPLGDAR